jgi:hypothetical protein
MRLDSEPAGGRRNWIYAAAAALIIAAGLAYLLLNP